MSHERARELWQRTLSGEGLGQAEQQELVKALQDDERLRSELLDDLELDGFLRAWGSPPFPHFPPPSSWFIMPIRPMLTVSETGDHMAFSDRKATVKLLKRGGELLRTWDFGTGIIDECMDTGVPQSLLLSRDGRLLLVIQETIRAFDTASGRERWNVPLADSPTALGLSPDGRFLVVSSNGGLLTLRENETGEILRELPYEDGSVERIRFAADGDSFMTADENAIVLWKR